MIRVNLDIEMSVIMAMAFTRELRVSNGYTNIINGYPSRNRKSRVNKFRHVFESRVQYQETRSHDTSSEIESVSPYLKHRIERTYDDYIWQTAERTFNRRNPLESYYIIRVFIFFSY